MSWSLRIFRMLRIPEVLIKTVLQKISSQIDRKLIFLSIWFTSAFNAFINYGISNTVVTKQTLF